jgi:hypothetical protein
MAQLKSGSTVGGNSILTTASSVGFPAGTVMVFHQASAPTGWVKSTANNDKALRVVSGSGGGSGGTHALTSPPSTGHTHTGPSHTHSTPNHSHSHTLSAGSHTLSTSEMPSHSHTLDISNQSGCWGPKRFNIGFTYNTCSTGGGGTTSTGGGGSHSHSLAGSISSSGASNTGASGTGTTSNSGPTAFAPRYIDVIVCTKS